MDREDVAKLVRERGLGLAEVAIHEAERELGPKRTRKLLAELDRLIDLDPGLI